MTIYSLAISADTPINPDSAFVDTVSEWHVNDLVWYEERVNVATIKCIKDYCSGQTTKLYQTMQEFQAAYIELRSLEKTHKYYFSHNEDITDAMYNINRNIAEYRDSKRFLPSIKASFSYIKNYTGKEKTQRFKKEALNVITLTKILSFDVDNCLTPTNYVIQTFKENYVE